MVCYYPVTAYWSREVNAKGKREITFDVSKGWPDRPVKVSCGQCIGCRLERSRQWAIRCMQEASMHKENSFITLTYNDENLPANGSLVLEDFQGFMKRFRQELGRKYNKKIRFFHAGEYGDMMGRPHYHAIIFGWQPDKEDLSNEGGKKSSKTLEKCWKLGYNVVGDVTFESAAYVARYCLKKYNGKDEIDHYLSVSEFGEMSVKKKEYCTMSRNQGIGAEWIKKYGKEVYRSDSVIMRGREMRPPKYYDGKYELIDGKTIDQIKEERKKKYKIISDEKLKNKERNAIARLNLIKRGYENEK